MSFSTEEKEEIRCLLCELGNAVHSLVDQKRKAFQAEELAAVSAVSESDTIYQIDRISESALMMWFEAHWPAKYPVEVVAEGLEEETPVSYPLNTPVTETRFKVIIDPIDGTRELMFDKRSAWVIAGAAPQKFEKNTLADIEVAMLTELPTTRQRTVDQISGFLGCGRNGLVTCRRDLQSEEESSFEICPSKASSVDHGVAALVKFFPEGKELTARLESELWQRLGLFGEAASPVIFDDQYISTGGQMYEMLMGHYRFYGDIRPAVLESLGLGHSLTCHPYDAAAGLLLTEAGCVYEDPRGGQVRGPLDTVTPVSWIAYANQELATLIRPVFQAVYSEFFDT